VINVADEPGGERIVKELDAAREALVTACRSLSDGDGSEQVVLFDLAYMTSALEAASVMFSYGERGEVERKLAAVFAADVLHEIRTRLDGRARMFGIEEGAVPGFAAGRDPALLCELAGEPGPLHLDDEFVIVRDTFRRFADERLKPVAEQIHRENADIPEEIVGQMAEMGCFGVSIPERYGGFASGGDDELVGMVVATEELSRGSLGVGGSLMTRPEILAKAILAGGTEEQKSAWLPRIASGELMVAIAVSEPDYGSDSANIKTAARHDGDLWRLSGVKTWCTFAGRADLLMVLARTDPDRSKAHRGLSVFVVEKPAFPGNEFALAGMQGRAIDTIGYRGMHSFEVAFDGFPVPTANLIGKEGRGFYYQMSAFANGRLQTAARAVGLMQAAYEAALRYAHERVVFGKPLVDYGLTRAKLTRMAALIQGCRQFTYEVARLLAKRGDEGQLEASMVKMYACRAAEWVTREAQQIHGGMGYAEEYPVSRYFVDARVLSIFEGAEEILALKVITRRLLEDP
jgi:(2S)-methylsuccinyl-CoA dehydrogenase